ncbi:hypothetical protein D3C72_786320 [compost metagenome]
MVDAQARVAAEAHHPVVPPGEHLLRLFEQAERIDEAHRDQRLEGVAFLGRDQVLALPLGRIVHVAVFRGDVEIAEQRQLGVARHFLAQPAGDGLEPVELVDELVRIERLAVREVGADQAHIAVGGGHHALLGVLVAGDVAHHVCGHRHGAVAGDDRHAVVGLLARVDAMEAGRLEFGQRVLVVGQLEFLEAERVDGRAGGVLRGEPLQHLWQAHLEGIDVPAGDSHRCSVWSVLIRGRGLSHPAGRPGRGWRRRFPDGRPCCGGLRREYSGGSCGTGPGGRPVRCGSRASCGLRSRSA